MTRWREYQTPASFEEALALLTRHRGVARIIAGGTDLILDMESGHTPPAEILVDVTRIQGIDQIRLIDDEDDPWIEVGAGVTHFQIERSPLLQSRATCLTESSRVVGGPQVRNVATIGGNVAHALPAADGTIGLLALDAEVETCGLASGKLERKWQPLLSIFAGPGQNHLRADEMIAAFRFRPTGPGQGSAFDRIMRPQGVALPVLGLAARLDLNEESGGVRQAAIAIGPAGPIPFRAKAAEAILSNGEPLDEPRIEAAIEAARAEVRLRTSRHRASKDYRDELIGVLMRRVLPRAAQRAHTTMTHNGVTLK